MRPGGQNKCVERAGLVPVRLRLRKGRYIIIRECALVTLWRKTRFLALRMACWALTITAMSSLLVADSLFILCSLQRTFLSLLPGQSRVRGYFHANHAVLHQ